MKAAIQNLRTLRSNLRTPVFSCYDLLILSFVIPFSASLGVSIASLLP
jgi:hypothetical protein